MPTRAVASWYSSEEGDEYNADKEDLVVALESYTRELGQLCGGLEVQHLEAEDDDHDEDINVGTDTLASLEEITGECTALLACLETEEENGSIDAGDEDNVVTTICHCPNPEQVQEQQPQGQELNESRDRNELTHELDSFADELKDFLQCLGELTTDRVLDDTQAPKSRSTKDTTCLRGEGKQVRCKSVNDGNTGTTASPTTPSNIVGAISTGDNGGSVIGTAVGIGTDKADLSAKKQVFSEQTKNAVTLHVKRLAFRKYRKHGAVTHRSTATKTKGAQSQGQEHAGEVKVSWSKFQTTSFFQHIMRQKLARRRERQIQEAQRLVESARLRGKPGVSYRRSNGKSCDQTIQRRTYLDQFKPASVHLGPSNEFEPRYLCAVYLYDHRRLGTTYITFSSLAQLEHRVRARFGVDKVGGIYREVTELVLPESALWYHTTRQRRLKRLQRISSLEHVNDGDTLCVTQNAYDDMTILCDWMKRRQRVVHGFQHEVQQSSANPSSAEKSTLQQPKSSGNSTTRPQVWDSNGHSIGVKTNNGI